VSSLLRPRERTGVLNLNGVLGFEDGNQFANCTSWSRKPHDFVHSHGELAISPELFIVLRFIQWTVRITWPELVKREIKNTRKLCSSGLIGPLSDPDGLSLLIAIRS